MRAMPYRRALEQLEMLSKILTEHPEATVRYVQRGSLAKGKEGDVGIDAGAELPAELLEGVEAKAGVEWRSQVAKVGRWDYVILIDREGRDVLEQLRSAPPPGWPLTHAELTQQDEDAGDG